MYGAASLHLGAVVGHHASLTLEVPGLNPDSTFLKECVT